VSFRLLVERRPCARAPCCRTHRILLTADRGKGILHPALIAQGRPSLRELAAQTGSAVSTTTAPPSPVPLIDGLREAEVREFHPQCSHMPGLVLTNKVRGCRPCLGRMVSLCVGITTASPPLGVRSIPRGNTEDAHSSPDLAPSTSQRT